MKWRSIARGAVPALLLLPGCSSVTVSRDYRPSADFSGLQRYAWQHAGQPKTGNPRIDNDLIDARVRSAVDAELAAKGFVRTEAGQEADFLVAYHVEYKQRIGGGTVSIGVGAGGYGRFGGAGYNTGISDYDEGYLTIDIIDAGDGKGVWRGVGRRTAFEHASPERTTKVVNHAVARILAKFPPGRSSQ